MSTYTDLHTRRRENLSILRQPGSAEDGITPQRVIFANPGNIYEGTFKGKVDAVQASFTSVDLTDATINGGKIIDATIYSDGTETSIAELTANVSEALQNITSAQLSCELLDQRIDKLVDDVIKVVDDNLSVLSTNLSTTLDEKLDSVSSSMFSQISSISTLLSNELSSESLKRFESDQAISTQLDAISSRFEIDELAFDQHVQNFNDHVQDNIDTFDFLSNYMLSSLEHDRHYAIVDDFKDIPYRVKDLTINVIEAGASNIQIKYGGNTIGYGTYVDGVDGVRKLRVAITTDDKIPALINAIPGTYNIDLKEGSANRQAVGGAYFYYITWLSSANKIVLDKIDQEYYDLVDTTYGTIVGKIKNAKVDDSDNFISGTIMFQAGGDFNDFYDAFPNGATFNGNELSSQLSNGCLVKFAGNKIFSLGKNVTTKNIVEIKDDTDDHNVFGRIVTTDISVDSDTEEILRIPVTGIDLTKYGIVKYNRSANLTKDNGFYSKIDSGLVISCDIDHENVFSIVATKEKFAYPYYKPTSIGPHELTDAIGYLIPNLENTPINGGVFNKLSVQTEKIDWSSETVELKTHECLSTAFNTYTCQEGTIGDHDEGWMNITVVKDVDTTWTINLDGYDGIKGVEIKATYKVDTNLCAIVPEDNTYTLIAQSIDTDIFDGEDKTFPEVSYTAIANGPKHIDGETTIDLNLENTEENSLLIQVPQKDPKYYDVAREFIVVTKITSIDEKIQFKLVNGLSDITYYSNGKKNNILIPANKWVSLRVTEVNQDKFLVEDLENFLIREELAKTNDILNKEIEDRESNDSFLSGKIDSNKLEIDDLWKNIRGGLNYIDNLSVAATGYDTVQLAFAANKTLGVTVPEKLREGFFWTIKTIDHNKHYFIEGIEVTHGDWFIIKNNTPLSDVTSANVTVLNVQDYDNFKLSGNNNISGNNYFTGNTTFNGTTNSIGTNAISGTNSISGTTEINGILKIGAETTIDNVNVKNISAESLSVELENFIYGNGLSNLNALTANLQEQLTSAQLSINGISSYSRGLSSALSGLSGEVSAISSYLVSAITLSAIQPLSSLSGEVSSISSTLTGNISYLSSELSDYHNTLSGIDRSYDAAHDIKSDNLILTDVNLVGGSDHDHQQYYMTFISGTVVFKPIVK